MGYPLPETEHPPALLLLDHIYLDYDEFEAIRDISLSVDGGEIHAIVGEHGAGKSTLAMIMSGMLRPKSGSIYFKGKKLGPLSPKASLKLGVRMVYQQICLNDYFTVAENLFYSTKLTGNLSWNLQGKMLLSAKNLLEQHGFQLDPAAVVKSLSLSDRAVVDILKQIYIPPRLLILDEALEKLSSASLEKALRLLLNLKEQGMSIVFITHKIDDIYSFCDKVSILRNGELIFTDKIKNIDKISLIRLAYTQMTLQTQVNDANLEFHRFLKYSEAILQHLPVSIVVTDNDYCVKMVNNCFRQYFQLERPEYENTPLNNLLLNRNPELFSQIRTAFETGEEQTIYHVPLNLGASKTLNNIKTFPIFEGQQVIGNILIIEDITQYDQLQRQVILSEKLASVGLLAAGVAHEINNPLEIVYNYIRFIKRNFKDNSLKKSIDRLHNEISNIATIVGNLVTFSDAQNISREEIHLNETIKNLLDLIKHNATYKHIHFLFTPAKRDIKVTINRNELRQVILNLVKNSFEAMPAGGTISIDTDLGLQSGEDVATVHVRDTGPGIQEANVNDIFLPFYSTKRASGSNMGLGLSISYAIVEKYRGKIMVHNLSEGGCEFIVQLPCAQPIPEATA